MRWSAEDYNFLNLIVLIAAWFAALASTIVSSLASREEKTHPTLRSAHECLAKHQFAYTSFYASLIRLPHSHAWLPNTLVLAIFASLFIYFVALKRLRRHDQLIGRHHAQCNVVNTECIVTGPKLVFSVLWLNIILTMISATFALVFTFSNLTAPPAPARLPEDRTNLKNDGNFRQPILAYGRTEPLPVNYSQVVVNGDDLMNHAEGYDLLAISIGANLQLDYLENPILGKSARMSIRSGPIKMPIALQNPFRTPEPRSLALLLVPRVVELHQFSTIKQAQRLGSIFVWAPHSVSLDTDHALRVR